MWYEVRAKGEGLADVIVGVTHIVSYEENIQKCNTHNDKRYWNGMDYYWMCHVVSKVGSQYIWELAKTLIYCIEGFWCKNFNPMFAWIFIFKFCVINTFTAITAIWWFEVITQVAIRLTLADTYFKRLNTQCVYSEGGTPIGFRVLG